MKLLTLSFLGALFAAPSENHICDVDSLLKYRSCFSLRYSSSSSGSWSPSWWWESSEKGCQEISKTTGVNMNKFMLFLSGLLTIKEIMYMCTLLELCFCRNTVKLVIYQTQKVVIEHMIIKHRELNWKHHAQWIFQRTLSWVFYIIIFSWVKTKTKKKTEQ